MEKNYQKYYRECLISNLQTDLQGQVNPLNHSEDDKQEVKY